MIIEPREETDVPSPGNPVTSVRHLTTHADGTCLGFMVLLWCPGCQRAHAPRFRCEEHGGPPEGPTWQGDPRSDPFTMGPSLLVHATSVSPACHSFIRDGKWEFLGDCTHALAGKTVPLEPLPNWLVEEATHGG